MMRKLAAEAIGTFMLVSAVCGAGALGTESYGWVAFAVGLTVTVMAYSVGHISGGHFNPAVTAGLVAGGRHPMGEAIPYIAAQVVGGVVAAFVWWLIASGKGIPADLGNFASNGFDGASPGGYNLLSAIIAEVVMTALFIYIIMGSTNKGAPSGFAPLAIGVGLAICVLVTIPITNGSINPARSTATAVFGGATALGQLWVFWLAPIVGGIGGGLIARFVQDEQA